MADPVRVGSTSEFGEGQLRGFVVEGLPVAVVRVGDRFYAFADYCTHEGLTLTAGYGVAVENEIVCLMHTSVFDIETGEPIEGPAYDRLPIYRVIVEGDDVLVAI
jgi:3-phenylpropionate/trans-cinnamate dioxygenase ferredoxin subunit